MRQKFKDNYPQNLQYAYTSLIESAEVKSKNRVRNIKKNQRRHDENTRDL